MNGSWHRIPQLTYYRYGRSLLLGLDDELLFAAILFLLPFADLLSFHVQ